MSASRKTYEVRGMTCDHCVMSVREEIAELGDVEVIELELGSGRLVVAGSVPADERLAAAVGEAGYELAGAGR